MTDAKISLTQKDKTVGVANLVSHDSILFDLMDKTPSAERVEMLNSVLHVGALAMLEERSRHLDLIIIELGYDLVKPSEDPPGNWVDRVRLVEKIKQLRKQLLREMGVPLPAVGVRDNLRLESSQYRILVRGVEIASFVLRPEKLMAIVDPNSVTEAIEAMGGEATVEPAFKMPAYWIDVEQSAQAEAGGYVVVNPGVVLGTHIEQVVIDNLPDLFGLTDAKQLLTELEAREPSLVEEFGQTMSLRELLRILRSLIRERIPIVDLSAILDTLAEHSESATTHEERSEVVRTRLARTTAQPRSPSSLDSH